MRYGELNWSHFSVIYFLPDGASSPPLPSYFLVVLNEKIWTCFLLLNFKCDAKYGGGVNEWVSGEKTSFNILALTPNGTKCWAQQSHYPFPNTIFLYARSPSSFWILNTVKPSSLPKTGSREKNKKIIETITFLSSTTSVIRHKYCHNFWLFLFQSKLHFSFLFFCFCTCVRRKLANGINIKVFFPVSFSKMDFCNHSHSGGTTKWKQVILCCSLVRPGINNWFLTTCRHLSFFYRERKILVSFWPTFLFSFFSWWQQSKQKNSDNSRLCLRNWSTCWIWITLWWFLRCYCW